MRLTPILLTLAFVTPVVTGEAVASDTHSPDAAAAALRAGADRSDAPRRGGNVRAAWPHKKDARKPRTRIGRFLAKQVGPVGAKRARTRRARSVSAIDLDSVLWLVRSFDVPKSDPAYDRLANYSWTYDNALATFAFISIGFRSGAEQLLDQLKALQHADGSIEYAFDTKTGTSSSHVRAGALAWVGLAATAYRREYGGTRYDKLIEGTLRYLLGLRNADGLVRGGPDATWVSTQHNLLTIGFLRDLGAQLGKHDKFAGYSKADLDAIQDAIGDALVARTLVTESPTAAYFRQGVGDDKIPVDVQAFGSLVLKLRGDSRANAVANTMQSRFFLPGRGHRPFIGEGAPDVAWSEGTIEAALALSRLGLSSSAADAAVFGIASTIRGLVAGPDGADREVVDPAWGEYHTWPTSAAASWLMIRIAPEQLLFSR
jgi:hypothetical protein